MVRAAKVEGRVRYFQMHRGPCCLGGSTLCRRVCSLQSQAQRGPGVMGTLSWGRAGAVTCTPEEADPAQTYSFVQEDYQFYSINIYEGLAVALLFFFFLAS